MKRLIAGPLWFLAFAFMYELLWSVAGVPRVVGPALGLVAAVTVWIDPLHWFWSAPPSRSAAGLPVSSLPASAK
jgi:hypothetical protein